MNRAAVPPSITDGRRRAPIGQSRQRDGTHRRFSRTTGFIAPRPRPRIATSGLFTIGVKCAAANAALVGDGEGAALELLAGDFPLAGFLGQLLQLPRQLEQALLVHVADDRHDQARLGVHRDADVIVLLENDLLGDLVEAGVEDRMLLQRVHDRLQRQRRSASAARPCFSYAGAYFFRSVVQSRDVGLVELRHVRDRRSSSRPSAGR